jgi:hypothetical protein
MMRGLICSISDIGGSYRQSRSGGILSRNVRHDVRLSTRAFSGATARRENGEQPPSLRIASSVNSMAASNPE